jgi:hypothetical protein
MIRPWFNKLRFYPIPALAPRTMGAEVSVASVSDVVATLAHAHTPEFMIENRQSVEQVLPLYDALIAAVLKTTAQVRAPEVVGGKGARRNLERKKRGKGGASIISFISPSLMFPSLALFHSPFIRMLIRFLKMEGQIKIFLQN